MDGSVSKLTITALPSPDTSSIGGGGVDNLSPGAALNALTPKIFEVQINPETISRNFSIKYHEPNTPGSNGSEFQFEKVNPEDLELKFILDGTGTVLPTAPGLDIVSDILGALPGDAQQAFVSVKIAQLQATVYNFSDEQHRTPFILVAYGKLVFMGILQNMSVNYNLFSPTGFPLRAEVTLSLKSHSPFKDSASLLSLLSPDLTKQHLVIGGENILRICLNEYKDEKYYIEIARANGVVNFRNIPEGTQLILPPIEKTGS